MQSLGRKDLAGAKPGEAVLSCSFNQDRSCLAVATRRGFKIYSCDTGTCVYDDDMGAVRIVEMLFCTSLLVVVGAGDTPELSPRRLKVLNTSNHTCIADLTFVTSILAVRLNRARLVVVEERRAVVHELSTLCVQRTIDTVQNPRGVCALSADDDSSLLALPAHAHAGSVVVHDCVNLHVVCELQCHNSPVAAMALTRDGAMLATASAKGTVIRVHCLPRGDKVWSFRRGVVNAKVRTLAFGGEASTAGEASDDSGEPGAKLLAASSEKGTVHVWRIEGPPRDKSETDIDHEERAFDEEPHHPRECDASHGVLSGVLKGGTKLVGGLLPSGLKRRVHDTWQPTRDAVTVHLPRPANDGSILDRAIGGVASVASTVTSAAAGIGNSRFKPNPEWPGIAGVCALRDGSNPTEVHVVAVNGDGLMCEYGADYVTGRVALTRECSVDDIDGAGFARGGGEGTNGDGDGAAVPGGARWLGGGDVGAPGWWTRGGSEREREHEHGSIALHGGPRHELS